MTPGLGNTGLASNHIQVGLPSLRLLYFCGGKSHQFHVPYSTILGMSTQRSILLNSIGPTPRKVWLIVAFLTSAYLPMHRIELEDLCPIPSQAMDPSCSLLSTMLIQLSTTGTFPNYTWRHQGLNLRSSLCPLSPRYKFSPGTSRSS